MSHFVTLSAILLFTLLSYTNGTRVPIVQFLSFRTTDGSAFTIPDNRRAEPDMSTYTNLINYLRRPDLSQVCVEGTWQFYELKSWEHIGGKTGLVLEGTGRMNESNLRVPTCLPFNSVNGTNYASKLSYRILGPDDLSQRSITLYEKRNYAGRELKITTIPLVPTNPINVDLPTVGSFRITAATDDDPTNPLTTEIRTIIKVYSIPNGVAATPGICYALINPVWPDPNNPKFYNLNQTGPGTVFRSISLIPSPNPIVDPPGCVGTGNSILKLPVV